MTFNLLTPSSSTSKCFSRSIQKKCVATQNHKTTHSHART